MGVLGDGLLADGALFGLGSFGGDAPGSRVGRLGVEVDALDRDVFFQLTHLYNSLF